MLSRFLSGDPLGAKDTAVGPIHANFLQGTSGPSPKDQAVAFPLQPPVKIVIVHQFLERPLPQLRPEHDQAFEQRLFFPPALAA